MTAGSRMIRVPVNPELLRWARHRAGLGRNDCPARFKKLPEWEAGRLHPTLRQLEEFARRVHVPFGTLLLDEPPEEPVAIRDYRTVGGGPIPQPSPNLLDTIYLCQERQAWYQDYLRAMGAEPLDFVCSLTADSDTRAAAEAMRDNLRITVDGRLRHRTPQKALSTCIASAESAGVLVMVSGIVGSNTRRRLDPREFRGFALADPLAPLVFVNGLDAKPAQMFTLAHELAHLWLGTSALSNLPPPSTPGIRKEEVWCSAVAAEFLVPLDSPWSREAARHESVRRSRGGDFHRTASSRLTASPSRGPWSPTRWRAGPATRTRFACWGFAIRQPLTGWPTSWG